MDSRAQKRSYFGKTLASSVDGVSRIKCKNLCIILTGTATYSAEEMSTCDSFMCRLSSLLIKNNHTYQTTDRIDGSLLNLKCITNVDDSNLGLALVAAMIDLNIMGFGLLQIKTYYDYAF
ncbi:UNVERIFIED_CONTAM: hypothetical protein NCL1_35331 [Trichonephila clavipes]